MSSLGKQVWRGVRILAVAHGFQSPAVAQSEVTEETRGADRLDYRAPPECPDAAAFRALVGGRLPRGWESAQNERARPFDVQVSGFQNRYVATLQFVDERGERVARTVDGELCASVVDGIALVTALAIQSRATATSERGRGSLESDAQPALAPSATGSANPASTSAATAPSAPRKPRPTSQERVPSTAPDASRAAVYPRKPLGLRVSGRAALSSGIGPNGAPGAALAVVYEPHGARLGLALQGFRTTRAEAQGVPVQFELWSARLEGCPFVLAISDSTSVEPCPFAEFGAMTGQAFEDPPAVVRGERGTAPWVSSGASGRVVGRFGAMAVELEVLVGIPLRRERFYVAGGETLYRVPAYYGAASAGVGVRF
jgi:hypothetical protein